MAYLRARLRRVGFRTFCRFGGCRVGFRRLAFVMPPSPTFCRFGGLKGGIVRPRLCPCNAIRLLTTMVVAQLARYLRAAAIAGTNFGRCSSAAGQGQRGV